MPLGFIKGNSYHQNWDYDRYAALPVFKLLCDYARNLELSLHFTYSHITRAFDCEIRQICYFKNSGTPYWLGLSNRGGDTPLEALCNALRASTPSTPLLEVLCLEAECVLLGMAVEKARNTEAKIEKVLEELARLCAQVEAIFDYDCENCIGMIEHGCYCKAMGASAPGAPPEHTSINPPVVVLEGEAPKPIPADPGEDDDL